MYILYIIDSYDSFVRLASLKHRYKPAVILMFYFCKAHAERRVRISIHQVSYNFYFRFSETFENHNGCIHYFLPLHTSHPFNYYSYLSRDYRIAVIYSQVHSLHPMMKFGDETRRIIHIYIVQTSSEMLIERSYVIVRSIKTTVIYNEQIDGVSTVPIFTFARVNVDTPNVLRWIKYQ